MPMISIQYGGIAGKALNWEAMTGEDYEASYSIISMVRGMCVSVFV